MLVLEWNMEYQILITPSKISYDAWLAEKTPNTGCVGVATVLEATVVICRL